MVPVAFASCVANGILQRSGHRRPRRQVHHRIGALERPAERLGVEDGPHDELDPVDAVEVVGPARRQVVEGDHPLDVATVAAGPGTGWPR